MAASDPDLIADQLESLKRRADPDQGTVWSTPYSVVHEQPRFRLLRFGEPSGGALPLLFCYALVNRPYILDLEPDRSTVARLVELGRTVYLIDWFAPTPADRDLTMADYALDLLGEAIERTCQDAGDDHLVLAGVCQGGVFSLCHTAAMGRRIAGLVTLVTPVDFHTDDNVISHLVRHIDAEGLARRFGNLPGAALYGFFIALKPMELGFGKYLDLNQINGDPARVRSFWRMERWISDCPDQAGRAFAQFVRFCYQENRLVENRLEIGGTRIDLTEIDVPVLNIFATRDHLVPASSSAALAGVIRPELYTEQRIDTGHIGLFVSRRSIGRVPALVDNWIRQRCAPATA